MSLPKIHELFRNITEDVSDVMPWDVHFFHGHMREVVNVVKTLAQDPDTDKRYPLIALQHDIKQSPREQGVEIACKLYIVTLSDPHYLADDRYTNIFDVYLRPIFRQFVQAIADSGYFEQATADEVMDKLTFYERLFWGSSSVMGNDANIFGDWVDCIEIDFDGLIAFESCEESTTYPAPKILSAFAHSGTDGTIQSGFVIFSKSMDDPSGYENDFNWKTNGEWNDGLPITQVNDYTFQFDLTPSGTDPTSTITLSVVSGNIKSTDGVLLPTYEDYPANNLLNHV